MIPGTACRTMKRFSLPVKDLPEASTPGTSMVLSTLLPGVVSGAAQLVCGRPLSAESARICKVRAIRRHAVKSVGRPQLVGSRAVDGIARASWSNRCSSIHSYARINSVVRLHQHDLAFRSWHAKGQNL